MAEGFLKSFDLNLDISSAGTTPGNIVHPKAIEVMQEVEIDISKNHPKSVNDFLDKNFITII